MSSCSYLEGVPPASRITVDRIESCRMPGQELWRRRSRFWDVVGI